MTLTITVQSTPGEPYAHEIEAGRHRLTADRTKDQGGSDRGPGPYSFLLAALGS